MNDSAMYRYEDYKQFVYSDAGQSAVLACADAVREAIRVYGACTIGYAMRHTCREDTWHQLAVVERTVELCKLTRIYNGATQDDILTR